MDHEHAQSLFTAYHDKELSAADTAALEAHLGQCEACSLAWTGYKAAVEEVSGLLRVVPAPDFSRRVQQTIGRRSRGRFFAESTDSGGMGVALISVIIVLVFALLYILLMTSTKVEVLEPPTEPSVTAPDRVEAGAGAAPVRPAAPENGSP